MSARDDFDLEEFVPDESALGRKDFLLNTAGLAAAAAAAGPFFLATKQANAAELASTQGVNPARIAVDAAKQFKGTEIKMTYEAGLQALDPKNFAGPMFEKLTGVKSNVIELDHASQFSKVIAEHISRSGAYDILDIEPAWVPSMVDGGVIEPLDPYIRKYRNRSAVQDLHPLYRALGTYKGRTYGFFDDGDVFALYYRKDIFNDPKLKRAYRAKFKRAMRVPRAWEEYSETAQFITDQMAPKVYGTAAFRKLNGPGNHFSFLQQFRSNGGQLFNASTMKCTISSAAGVKTLRQMLAQNKASLKGTEQLDAVAVWAAWLQGKVAMIYSWPPTGRMSENYSQRDKSFSFIPKSSIVGKTGYTIMPGKNGEHASGYVKALSADSKNKDAAYLFMQWVTSPEISLQRVTLPYALRDPYRISHFRSPQYRKLWPGAKDYLSTLNDAANNAVLDLIMPGWQDYAVTLDRMCTAVWSGADPKAELDKAAADWDRTTQKLGEDKQRAAYGQFLKLPGSTARNTIAAQGKSVRI